MICFVQLRIAKVKRLHKPWTSSTSLETTVRSTRLLMQHGTSTYLEVLTAQQGLLSAQLTQVADRFDEIQGIINLYQALGGGRE